MSETEGTRPDPGAAESQSSASQPDSAAASQPAITPTSSPQTAATAAAQSAPTASAPKAAPATTPYSGPWASAGHATTAAPGQASAQGAFGQTAPTLPVPPAAAMGAPAKKKSGAGRVTAIIVAAALVGGGAGLGATYAGFQLWAPTTETAAASPTVVTVNDTESVNATTAVAAKVVPSVVTISVSSGSSGGTGSGVILSADGYVLTNTHVVTLDGETANPTISVTTSDGHVYSATVVGTDPTYDLAVIKLEDASGLTPIEFADSSDLNVGDEAIAVGAPLGLSNTVTTGIVSALNRSISIASSEAPSTDSGSESEDSSPFQFDFGQEQQSTTTTSTIKIAVIQTDAAINPGNSGGALVDSDGNLIGINVAIASSGSTSSSSSGNIGVGFAIPSSVAERIANEIIENGSATHGLLGASVGNASSESGATIEGALIDSVVSGGAAAAAGLQSGDIITEFNGLPITGAIDLTAQVRALAAGTETTLSYVRDGVSHTATVTLGSLQ